MKNILTESQLEYRHLLVESIGIFQDLNKKSPNIRFNEIIAQMEDILRNVVDEQIITNWYDIDERYSLGAIAVNEFPDESELQDRLCAVFAGALEFNGPLADLFED